MSPLTMATVVPAAFFPIDLRYVARAPPVASDTSPLVRMRQPSAENAYDSLHQLGATAHPKKGTLCWVRNVLPEGVKTSLAMGATTSTWSSSTSCCTTD